MDVTHLSWFSWGSPVGLGVFFIGLGVFFWGFLSGVATSNKAKKPPAKK